MIERRWDNYFTLDKRDYVEKLSEFWQKNVFLSISLEIFWTSVKPNSLLNF